MSGLVAVSLAFVSAMAIKSLQPSPKPPDSHRAETTGVGGAAGEPVGNSMSILMQDHATVERVLHHVGRLPCAPKQSLSALLELPGQRACGSTAMEWLLSVRCRRSHAAGWRIVIGDNDQCTCLLGIVDLGFEVA